MSAQLRIGLEASNVSVRQPTGVSRYIIEYGSALADLTEDAPTLFYKATRWRKRDRWWRPAALPSRTYLGDLLPPRKGIDLIHGLDCMLPPWRKARRVVTFHDLVSQKFSDDQLTPASFRHRQHQRYKQTLALADAIVVPSESTGRDLQELFGVAPERLRLIPHGIDDRFMDPSCATSPLPAALGLEPGYLLFIGAISGRKNTERLVRAAARSGLLRDRQLVLAGSLAWRGEDTISAIEQEGVAGRVRILGYLPDKDLPALYAAAGAFAFPTFYEGFGIPILEAMACQTPVLCGNIGSAPEVAGGHAICVDPADVEAITAGLHDALGLDQARLAAARTHAIGYSWERCARAGLALYRDLI